MNQPSQQPARPAINLQQADPLIQALTQKARMDSVLKKYGQTPMRQMPKAPPIQWEGDPNG